MHFRQFFTRFQGLIAPPLPAKLLQTNTKNNIFFVPYPTRARRLFVCLILAKGPNDSLMFQYVAGPSRGLKAQGSRCPGQFAHFVFRWDGKKRGSVKVVFDHETDEMNDVTFWSGAFRSDRDGCWHCMVTDYEIAGPNDTYELIVIPRDECRVMYE
jgi:hypothetical protein